MLQQDRAVSAKEQCRAVQRAAVLLNDADFDVYAMRPGRLCDHVHRRRRHSHGRVVIPAIPCPTCLARSKHARSVIGICHRGTSSVVKVNKCAPRGSLAPIVASKA